jgi:hypothetical protein
MRRKLNTARKVTCSRSPRPVPQCQTKELTRPITRPSLVKRRKRRERENKGTTSRTIRWLTDLFFLVCQALTHTLIRRLHPDQAEEQRDRVVVQQSKLKLASMFPSLTVHPMMPPHQS